MLAEIESQVIEAEHLAIKLLAMHEHTEKQLREKLLKKSFSWEDIQVVLTGLKQQNMLSDSRFAEQYVQLRSRKGYGPVRIAQELRDKGVSEELIDTYVDYSDHCWLQQLNAALLKKFGKMPVLNFSEQAKRARFLEYRGFPVAMIRKAVFDD